MPGSPSERDRFWAHATGFGALWGALEVTIGAYLHTVRIPFGGALLAATGAGLMAAQRQVLPVRGASLATGMVTALCKTASPGGVLVGPMAGILTEAALFEAALLFAPRSLVSAAAGGFLAVTWAGLQKILVQFLFYGSTLLELYLAILRKAGEWAGLPDGAGVWAVGAFVGVLGGTGAVVAVAGGRYGRAALRSMALPEVGPTTDPVGRESVVSSPGKPQGGGGLRVWMTILALACIGALVTDSTPGSVVALSVWLTVQALVDRVSFRRLWMPGFWGISLAFALASGLLLGEPDLELAGVELSTSGFEAGVRLLVRGALVFGISCWATRAMASAGILRLAERAGAGRLGLAVTVALGLLPELADRIRDPATPRGRGPGLVAVAVRLAERLARRRDPGCPIVAAVVGPPGSGKTSTMNDLVERLRSRGLRVGGVTQPAIAADGIRTGYRLRDAGSGEEREFARRAGAGRPGFLFDEDGWTWAARRIREARLSADAVIVDELGRIESEGGGHLPAIIEPLAGEQARIRILAIREDRLASVSARVGRPYRVVSAGCNRATLDDLERFVVSFCAGSPEPERPLPEVRTEP
jgi:nucleoside-triphosphatase THEP1